MLHVNGIRDNKRDFDTHIYNKIIVITITVFLSVLYDVVIAGIYNYLCHDPFCIYFAISKHLNWSWFFIFFEVTQIFIPEKSRPLEVLPELNCCSVPFIFFTGHGNTKRCPKVSSVFQTHSFLPVLLVIVQFPLCPQGNHRPTSSHSFLCLLIQKNRTPKGQVGV